MKNAYQKVALKDCILVLHFYFVSYLSSGVCITGFVKEQINPWLTDAVRIEIKKTISLKSKSLFITFKSKFYKSVVAKSYWNNERHVSSLFPIPYKKRNEELKVWVIPYS